MRLFFLTKKQQKQYIAYLVGLTRVIHRNNVQLFKQDFESYEFCLKALCELSYLVGDIPAMQIVKHFGLEEDDSTSAEGERL